MVLGPVRALFHSRLIQLVWKLWPKFDQIKSAKSRFVRNLTFLSTLNFDFIIFLCLFLSVQLEHRERCARVWPLGATSKPTTFHCILSVCMSSNFFNHFFSFCVSTPSAHRCGHRDMYGNTGTRRIINVRCIDSKYHHSSKKQDFIFIITLHYTTLHTITQIPN